MSKDNQETGLQTIRGVRFPSARYSSRKTIEEILDYIPHDGDIIVASYPKTGSTWLQYIVLQIVSNGNCYPSFDDVLYKMSPLMELTGIKTVEEMKQPRTYSHHCPYNLVQKNPKAKYLYIYRRPEDTLISYFHFLKTAHGDSQMDFDRHFENFLSGEIGYGRYFEHVLSYLEHKEDENLLLISYEKLHVNRKEEFLRIAKFLGEEYYRNLSNEESILEGIIEKTGFEYMKKNLPVSRPKHFAQETREQLSSSEDKSDKVDFFRKGIIGDGKKTLSENQLKRLQDIVEEVMKGSEIVDEWTKN